MNPFIGASVHYRLAAADIQIYSVEFSVPYAEGDIVAAVISRVIDADPEGTGECSLRLLPDGVSVPPATAIRGTQPGQWDWPPAET